MVQWCYNVDMGENELVTAGQIIKLYKIPRTTLYRMVEEGRLPVHNVTKAFHRRRQYRFDPAEVARVLGEPR